MPAIRSRWILGVLPALLAAALAPAQTPLSTGFSYQGQVSLNDAPLNGTADFQFKLWSAPASGAQVGSTVSVNAVTVADGLVQANLDFGAAALNGDERYLEIAVRSPAGAGTFTTLAPRQRLAGTPYAVQTRGLYVDASERVGIGTSAPQNALHVVGPGDALAIEGTNHVYMEYFPDGFAAGRKAFTGFPSNGNVNFVLQNDATGGSVILRSNSGNIGINMAPNATPLSPISFPNVLGEKIRLWGGAADHYGIGVQGSLMQFYTDAQGADIGFGFGSSASFTERMRVRGNGNVGIGTSTPATKLHVMGPIRMQNGGHVLDITSGGAVDIASSTSDIYINTPNANRVLLQTGSGSVGIGTTSPQAKLDVAGVARADTIQIDAGADVAERYDIAATLKDGQIIDPQPGMVVSIDPRQVGKLVVSSRALDKRVAGVVSGAGDVRPGLTLSQPGTVADGEHAVAAVGRVWCLVDSDANGPVQAGDLLTTSDTPGHAMRVDDGMSAGGAIIGKAMSSLEKGRGLVLVLVSLQ